MTTRCVSRSSLRTTQPLNHGTIAATKTSLEEIARKGRNLDRHIVELRALHNSFVLERQALLRLIEGHKALLSPLNGLPTDILEEIFYHCLPTTRNATMSPDEPPLLFGRVSKRWREVVYSSPRMWATLHIVVLQAESPQYKQRMEDMTKSVDSWLSRSGALPLSISIYHNNPSSSAHSRRSMDRKSQLLLNTIAHHSHRWRAVYLSLRNIDWPQLLSQLPYADVPMLETLCIKDNLRSCPWNASQASDAVTGLAKSMGILRAPTLRALDLPGYLAHRLCNYMQWHSLTSLGISYWDFPCQAFAGMLSHLPNLIECLIRISYDPSETWPDEDPATSFSGEQSPITFPKLRSLLIFATPDDDSIVQNMFRWISAPSLIHLAWKRTYHDASWSSSPLSFFEEELVQSFREFLSRLVSPLEELDLSLQPVSQSTLIRVLESVPSVKRLSTGGYVLPPSRHRIRDRPSSQPRKSIPYHHDDEILQRFTPGSMHNRSDRPSQPDQFDNRSKRLPCLCPNLEILKYDSHAQFSHQLLLELIRSRSLLHPQNHVARLRTLSIQFPFTQQPLGPLSDAEESRIVAIEKDWGIKINIEYPLSSPMGWMNNEGMAVGTSGFESRPASPLLHQWASS
ncbi:hypothetical protein NP233_g677 [Leucocoprinus birnbaumii]|uniref:F-box domain-containing protein n=1 Tax=Leucocoprinus birnbaumii TaxID=56174 RepID=A0AAD5W1R6_9AGAR|nr:hypothetical protein NP233_g677 [Leucocoprinus birnbaumii]